MLTLAEKYSYAKAVFEPLLETLSSLSSAEFYKQLAKWEGVVHGSSREQGSSACETTHESEESEDD